MKKIFYLLSIQLLLSILAGSFLSEMNFLERIGFHFTNYSFLKVWWQASLVVFTVQALLILILWSVKRFSVYKNFIIVNLLCIILGILGLFYSYYQFTNSLYVLLNKRFKIGTYIVFGSYFFTTLSFFFFRVKPLPKKNSAFQSEITPLTYPENEAENSTEHPNISNDK